MTQDQLCCFILKGVEPVYPRESRLAHTEGVVKLTMIIAGDGSVADLQAVSGDPLLLDSAISAVRQWRFQPVLLNGSPTEAEVPLSFTFSIQVAPSPAYLHLTNGSVIRADEVREFTDRMEYTVGRHTHHLSPDSVTAILACGRDCVLSGGPSFDIHAIPLLPAVKSSHSRSRDLHRLVGPRESFVVACDSERCIAQWVASRRQLPD